MALSDRVRDALEERARLSRVIGGYSGSSRVGSGAEAAIYTLLGPEFTSATDIATVLGVPEVTVTRYLNHLVERRIADRRKDGADVQYRRRREKDDSDKALIFGLAERTPTDADARRANDIRRAAKNNISQTLYKLLVGQHGTGFREEVDTLRRFFNEVGPVEKPNDLGPIKRLVTYGLVTLEKRDGTYFVVHGDRHMAIGDPAELGIEVARGVQALDVLFQRNTTRIYAEIIPMAVVTLLKKKGLSIDQQRAASRVAEEREVPTNKKAAKEVATDVAFDALKNAGRNVDRSDVSLEMEWSFGRPEHYAKATKSEYNPL